MPKTFYCPFYSSYSDKKKKLNVYGECGEIRFRDYAHWDSFVDRYCNSEHGWEKCSLATALLEDYQREELSEAR